MYLIWGGLWSVLDPFGFHFEGLGGPKAALEVPEPWEASGRGRVGSGSAGEPILVPTWAQHGPNLGPKIDEKTIKK